MPKRQYDNPISAVIAELHPDAEHELYERLGECRTFGELFDLAMTAMHVSGRNHPIDWERLITELSALLAKRYLNLEEHVRAEEVAKEVPCEHRVTAGDGVACCDASDPVLSCAGLKRRSACPKEVREDEPTPAAKPLEWGAGNNAGNLIRGYGGAGTDQWRYTITNSSERWRARLAEGSELDIAHGTLEVCMAACNEHEKAKEVT